jgi:hypothetical protein
MNRLFVAQMVFNAIVLVNLLVLHRRMRAEARPQVEPARRKRAGTVLTLGLRSSSQATPVPAAPAPAPPPASLDEMVERANRIESGDRQQAADDLRASLRRLQARLT